MTTAVRITISVHEVHAALADWHAQHASRTEPERALAHEAVEISSSHDYAQRHAAFFFALLAKHAENP